jgi:hypothetical protein
MAACYRHSNEPSGFIEDWYFLEHLSDISLLKGCVMELVINDEREIRIKIKDGSSEKRNK